MNSGRADVVVAAMNGFIDCEFQDAIRPRDVARSVGLSLAHAGTIYRRATGHTLSDAITRRRIGHALRLLEDKGSELPMTKVALESGFGSISRFYEAFRQQTGGVPGQLRGRKANRDGLRFVLWVDDRPNNNIVERRALAHLGIFADTLTANHDALSAIRRMPYSLVISDISREDQRESGWDVATLVRGHAPLIYYTSRDDSVRRTRARRVGALGLFTTSVELLDAVSNALN